MKPPDEPTGMYDGSSREAITTFKALLDTAAACGQLAAEAA